MLEWEKEIQKDEEGGQAVKARRDKVTAVINLIKSEADRGQRQERYGNLQKTGRVNCNNG